MTLSWRTRTTLPTSLCATDPSLNDNCSNGWTELHYREADPRCGKALVETSHLCKSFQLVDETETDPMFEDTTLGHQAMFEAAKKTVMQMAHVDTVQGLTCDAQVIDVKGHLAENHTLFRNRHSTQCSALRLGPPRVASGRGHELARVLPMLQIASLTSRPVTRNNFYSGPHVVRDIQVRWEHVCVRLCCMSGGASRGCSSRTVDGRSVKGSEAVTVGNFADTSKQVQTAQIDCRKTKSLVLCDT